MATIFDTNTLILVVRNLALRKPVQFLLDMFFTLKINSETEAVTVDIEKGKKTIAPLVAPRVKGKLQENATRESRIIKPAYVKPLYRVTPQDAIKRALGEAIAGTLSQAQRLDILTQDAILRGLTSIDRRMEVMAADCLVNGTVTLVGDEYPEETIDFQRDAALTGWTPGTDWDDVGATPLDDLDTINSLLISKGDVGATDFVFDPEAWKLFRKDAAVKDLLKNFSDRNPGVSLPITSMEEEGGVYMGAIGNYRLWQYQATYVDPLDGTTKKMIPDNTLMAANRTQLQGVRHYGAIQDIESGLQALDYFVKVREKWDPSSREILVQSAPLVSIERPDVSLAGTVAGN